MDTIKIGRIIRTNRKTIALVVNQDATLVVRAPHHITDDYIEGLVHRKEAWIKSKQDEMRRRSPRIPKEFVSGESFIYLGKNYKLQIVEDADFSVDLKGNLLISKDALPEAQENIIEWYRARAKEKIPERVERIAKMTGLSPASVRITDAMKRWGSCGPKGTLNFSWRLVMAPIEIIDYVVVHEMVHLEEKNHSEVFWRKMRTIMPDYEKRQEWLKRNENLLRV